MAIEKGLYDLPEGIEDMAEGEAMVAIDVMSDEGVEVVLEDGSVEITFGEEIEGFRRTRRSMPTLLSTSTTKHLLR
jgi:hypothetical protein